MIDSFETVGGCLGGVGGVEGPPGALENGTCGGRQRPHHLLESCCALHRAWCQSRVLHLLQLWLLAVDVQPAVMALPPWLFDAATKGQTGAPHRAPHHHLLLHPVHPQNPQHWPAAPVQPARARLRAHWQTAPTRSPLPRTPLPPPPPNRCHTTGRPQTVTGEQCRRYWLWKQRPPP